MINQGNFNPSSSMSQRSSFVTLAEEITAMNKNTVEITTKLNEIVSSQDSAVVITLIDSNGNKSDYYMPTVGYLKKELDKLNTNIKRLAGIESTSNIIDGKSIKKVYTVDINKEPYPIDEIGNITKFESLNNHFFDSLTNPLLAVEIDVSDKVTSDVNKILSRRYMIKFERNLDFSLTEEGLQSYNSFRDKFLNRTDIEILEFEEWYSEQKNIGILLDVVDPFDEQEFNLSVNEVNNHGLFSVIKTETDTINKKMWYHLNTLNYYTKDGIDKSLSIGDCLILNKLKSSSRWVIKEINKESSNFRVSFERLEGYDPVPIGTNVLSYYSDLSNTKKVKISIGFDEYCIIFIKPINTENNVISTLWSKGTCFYTNDLFLNNDDSTNLSQYYLRNVYDYGKILKDLVLKKIPTEYGEIPNVAVLDSENFKVVQINKHLTDTQNTRVLRNLHSQKITSKTKISQINNAIIEKNKEINTKTYSTTAESNAVKNELKKLIDEQDRETKTLSSTVSQISTKINENKDISKFRVRGFWNIPQPIYNGRTEPQHIIQFKVQYRYSSKSGEINPTEGFKIKYTPNSEKSDNQGKVVLDLPNSLPNPEFIPTVYGGVNSVILKGNVKSTISSDENSNKEKTAYFSNWVEFITDARRRYWDSERGIWYWKIEDVEDADTPNINQIDVPIKPNEKVEIRIKSISEVGWPETKIESNWSDIIVIEFPDEMDNILDENEFILKEANQDETLVSVENTLNSRGVYKHIQDSFYINETYYAHTDKGVQSSFKDNSGNYMSMYEYLNILTNKIKILEDQVNKVKGELIVYLHTPDTVIPIKTNDIYNIIVELEDYCEKTGSTRSYFNNIGFIDDYYIEIKNASSSQLLLLSNRKYEKSYANTYYQFEDSKVLTVDYNGDMYTQFDYQYVWFSDNSNGNKLYSGTTTYDDTSIILSNIYNYNIGWNSGITGVSEDFFDSKLNIISDVKWKDENLSSSKPLMVTVHPRIYNSSDLVESGSDKFKTMGGNTNIDIPIYIYYKLDGKKSNNEIFTVLPDDNAEVKNRSVKCFIETDTLTKPFEFEIKFKLRQFREVVYTTVFDNNININSL